MPQVLTATITDPQSILWTGQLVTASTTIGPGDTAFRCDSTSGSFTITLPAADASDDRVLAFILIANNSVTIDPNGSETINGQSTYVLTQLYESVIIWSDGSNWLILSGGTGGGGGEVQKSSLFTRSAGIGRLADSDRRDNIVETGSATVTTATTELRLQTTAAASDEAKVHSWERGRLRGGDNWIEYGVTARVPTAPTGQQEAFWGAFDDDYGIGFGQDATDYFIFTRRGTTTTKIYQSNWNQDTLSGLDSSKAAEYIVRVPHHSYGGSEFIIREFGSGGVITETLVHRFAGVTGAINSHANLPLSAACDNGTTATAFNLYIGDRWCAFEGTGQSLNSRIYGQFFINRSPTTTETVFQSLRKRSGALNQAVNVRLYDMEVVSDQDILCQLYTGATLTAASWGDIPNTSEAVVERDISATAFSNGNLVYGCVGSKNNNNYWVFKPDQLVFAGTEPISMTARTTSGTSSGATHLGLRIIEEW